MLPSCSELSLGRSSHCDITIAGNTNISREHACLRTTERQCFLIDQGSTNKCFVEDIQIPTESPTELQSGMRFALADEIFEIK